MQKQGKSGLHLNPPEAKQKKTNKKTKEKTAESLPHRIVITSKCLVDITLEVCSQGWFFFKVSVGDFRVMSLKKHRSEIREVSND